MLHQVVSLAQDTLQAKHDALADIAEDTSIAHAASVWKQNAYELIASIDLAVASMKEDEDEDELPDDYYVGPDEDKLTPEELENSEMDTEGMQFDFDDYDYDYGDDAEIDFWIFGGDTDDGEDSSLDEEDSDDDCEVDEGNDESIGC